MTGNLPSAPTEPTTVSPTTQPSTAVSAPPVTVAVNLAGVVEHPGLDGNPYLVDADGRPYLPVGDSGVVLGVELGDSVFAFDAEHASPAVSLVHPEQPARHSLTAFACLGNRVTVRGGAASGARGAVLGKRGELGRVLAWFPPGVRESLVPGDPVAVRGHGQGAELPPALAAAGGRVLNVDPAVLDRLPVEIGDGGLSAGVRGIVGSALIGNGIGRPAHQWNLDVQVDADGAAALGLAGLLLGDLLAVRDLDVRHNAGYRRGWTTIGVVVTTTSPRPGHGVGLMPILCVPAGHASLRVEPDAHTGVTAALLGSLDD
ncbi:MAG TPA: DUF4438 domain-containing protein [Rugosimonospora sp.]|jgi:hypothetical protein